MNSTSDSNCGSINSDVSGVGVRASLYASVTIGLAMTRSRTSFITSIALVISAMVSLYGTQGLALVDALVVTTITSLVMTYTFIVGSQGTTYARRIAQKDEFKLTYTLSGVAIVHTALWAIFGFMVWANPNNFGRAAIAGCDPNPNLEVVFWLFGYTVPIDNNGIRAWAMLCFASGAVGSICLTLFGLYATRAAKNEVQNQRYDIPIIRSRGPPGGDEPLPLTELPPTGRGQVPEAVSTAPAPESLNVDGFDGLRNGSAGQPRPFDNMHTSGSDIERLQSRMIRAPFRTIGMWMKVIFAGGGIGAYIYLIVMTESVITVNGQRSQMNALTFGQILSLVLLLDQIVFQPMTQIFNSLLDRALREAQRERTTQQGLNAAHGGAGGAERVGEETPAQQYSREARANN